MVLSHSTNWHLTIRPKLEEGFKGDSLKDLVSVYSSYPGVRSSNIVLEQPPHIHAVFDFSDAVGKSELKRFIKPIFDKYEMTFINRSAVATWGPTSDFYMLTGGYHQKSDDFEQLFEFNLDLTLLKKGTAQYRLKVEKELLITRQFKILAKVCEYYEVKSWDSFLRALDTEEALEVLEKVSSQFKYHLLMLRLMRKFKVSQPRRLELLSMLIIPNNHY